MIKRNIISVILEISKVYPILTVNGPRQSGKTTMLRQVFPSYEYVSLENPDNRLFAESDPNGFLDKYSTGVILDEVQNVPQLFSYLQTFVDNSGLMGRFILSGSQNFLLMDSITQSLAGRVAIFKLLPFDFSELDSGGYLPSSYEEMIIKGSYPAVFNRNIPVSTFYSNYIETYVERDLKDLMNIKDLSAFRRFLKLCAGRVGQQLNYATLSNDVNVSLPTVHSWLSILESSFIVYQVQPFFNNFNKRVVKTPKLFFYDTGLVCFLLGIKKPSSLTASSFVGHLFENAIINEFIKQNYHLSLQKDFYYWRDSNKNEVDLMISNETGYNIVEIKSTRTVTSDLFESLNKLAAIGGDSIKKKILVYGGTDTQNRTNYQVWSWKDIKTEF
jgi:uncharacterized protein